MSETNGNSGNMLESNKQKALYYATTNYTIYAQRSLECWGKRELNYLSASIQERQLIFMFVHDMDKFSSFRT